ncbi:MAG TPA: IPT/TIG domain-containing protein [Pirellulales bacterium]|nr:IPT/TIG domain-containing protein [Pirellulales bacterium]
MCPISITGRFRRGVLTRLIFLVVICLHSSAICCAADDNTPATAESLPTVTKLEPAEALRGTQVCIFGTNFAGSVKDFEIRVGDVAASRTSLARDRSYILFTVPDDAPLGRNTVRVTVTVNHVATGPLPVPVPGHNYDFTVLREPSDPLKLTGVEPAVVYPRDSRVKLRLFGSGFSHRVADNVLIRNDMEEVGLTDSGQAETNNGTLRAKVVSSRELVIYDVPSRAGQTKIAVRVGDDVSNDQEVTFSCVSEFEPLLLSAALTMLMVVVVFFVIRGGVGSHRIDGTDYGPLQVLFLDKETDTYSLSKLQLYLWTTAAIFGYTYLAIARSMIQAHIELPPVPQNLASLLLVSLGTMVGAEAITGVHGPKGAGKVLPSFADFVTSGGVVAAERLQFFVWTCVSVIGFLSLIVISNPSTIEQLPPIPDGLLYMMGISSTGYLGGKLARKPGPIIDSIAAQHVAAVAAAPPAAAVPASLVVVLEGRNLSSKADFYIDGVVVKASPPDGQETDAQMDATLKVIHDDAGAADKSFAATLQLTLTDLATWQARGAAAPLAGWLAAPHKFKIVNPDGQEAEWPFTIHEPAE